MGGQSGSWTPTKRRGPIAAEFQGPGPAALTLPSLFGNESIKESGKSRAPAFTFGSRHEKKAMLMSPAPNAYNTSGLNSKGKDESRSPSMHIKPKDPRNFVTPSPCAYNPDLADKDIKQSAPKYSFGIKSKDTKPTVGPAPNAYTLANVKDAPSYSLSSRPKEPKKFTTPAPGSYDSSDANSYKTKSPAYSLSTRYPTPSDTTLKPGPGAYTPEKANLDRSPAHAFGIKHSPYIGHLKGDEWVAAQTELGTPIANGGKSGSITSCVATDADGTMITNGGTVMTTTTRTHSDGHRIRTDTFSYTKSPMAATSLVKTKHYKAEQVTVS